MLTSREFLALKARWNLAHGINPPLTKEQRENLEWGKRYILEQQIKARNRALAKRNSGIKEVPLRRSNG